MSGLKKQEEIGRIYRTQSVNRERLAFINSELSGVSVLLKKASSQLECLLAHERSDINAALSQIDINRVVQLIAAREKLMRDIDAANEQLKRLGAP